MNEPLVANRAASGSGTARIMPGAVAKSVDLDQMDGVSESARWSRRHGDSPRSRTARCWDLFSTQRTQRKREDAKFSSLARFASFASLRLCGENGADTPRSVRHVDLDADQCV